MRIVFAGTPEFAVPALAALFDSRHTVVGVLTQPDRPKGRGRQVAASPVKLAALSHHVPLLQPQSLKSAAERAELEAWRPDVIVVVAYGLILPQAVLDLPRLGCVNIHASLLPRWRGAAPIQRAVLAGDQETGVTLMLMDSGLDTGPMLLRENMNISPTDTAGSLHDRLSALGAPVLLRALEGLESGTLRAEPQPSEGVTYAAKITKAEARIDWTQSAEGIARKVRAFNPRPVAEARLDDEPLRIHAASVAPAEAISDLGQTAAPAGRFGSEPGTIALSRGGDVLVTCGSGTLLLTEVQRPGRRPVAGRDFANTHSLAGRRFV